MINKRLKKSKVIQEELHVTKSIPKRIGFFSAVIMTIGGCIGSGIFFKSGSVMGYCHNSILLSLGTWLIAGLAVIAMAIALIDIASQSKKDNRGFLSWIRKFNSFMVYKMAKNYFIFFYVPTNWFIVPVYLFQSLQSGLCYLGASIHDGNLVYSQIGLNILNFPWWGVLLIVLAINCWFIFVSGLSMKVGNFTSLVINSIKFLPLVFALLIGFIIIGVNHGSIPSENTILYHPIDTNINSTNPSSFFMFSPVLGVFMALSAIFFAYDGFYVASGLGDQLKEPKKIPWILLTGLLIVTGIYLVIALSITLGSPSGSWDKIGIFFVKKHLAWIYAIINLIITIGILGSLNGYAMWGPMLYETFLESYELPFSRKLNKYLHKKRPYVGIFYQFILGMPVTVICFIIGVYAYHLSGSYGLYITKGAHNHSLAYLYSFCDLISNWQTTIVFLFISFCILSYAINTCKKTYKSKKDYLSITCAFISSFVVFIGMLVQIISPIVNLSIECHSYYVNHLTHNSNLWQSIVANISLLAVLLGIILLCVVPSIIEKRNKVLYKIYSLEMELMNKQLELVLLEAKREELLSLNRK